MYILLQRTFQLRYQYNFTTTDNPLQHTKSMLFCSQQTIYNHIYLSINIFQQQSYNKSIKNNHQQEQYI